MFYIDSQQNRYTIGTPFTYNSIQYSAAGASHATFMSLGFTQVIPEQRPDDRFYVVSGPTGLGTYTSTPRDLVGLKSDFVEKTKRTAWQLLSGTDWYIIRALEEPITYSVPTGIHDYRVGIRTVSDARCDQINACSDVAALKDLIDAPLLVLSNPSDPTSGYVSNTSALTAFPELPNTARSY